VKPKPAQRRSKRTAAARSRTEAARDVALFDNLAVIRDLLAEQIVLSTDRLQEAIDDAVRRGRMLPTDAQDLGDRLRRSGRRQLDELLVDIDRRLGGR
jgi:polyhydroxyalkanoate synthesis regulator phasin